jgi:3-oxoacyl-[acyl-carrier protein] reductase
MGKQRLEGKVAIVTGAGQGIGKAIATVFAREGARVIVATRTASSGEDTVACIRDAGGEAVLCTVDIGALESTEQVINATLENFGQIDILVHNAASFLGAPIDDYSEEDMETVFAVNLKACFRLSHACIPHMRKLGAGRILMTSSVTGPRVAMTGSAYYAASKSGVNGFIRTAALELARDNITVNGVEPGYIATPAMSLLADEEGQKQMAKYIPVGYIGAPEDIAYAMLFLASDEARYITGQTIVVDGGSTLPESPAFLDDIGETAQLQGS